MGFPARFFWASLSASAILPSRSSLWISGMIEAASALPSSGLPAQRLSSLSWMVSSAGLPNTMAPMRPFPTGRASFQSFAGCLYHRVFSRSFPKENQSRLNRSRSPAGPSNSIRRAWTPSIFLIAVVSSVHDPPAGTSIVPSSSPPSPSERKRIRPPFSERSRTDTLSAPKPKSRYFQTAKSPGRMPPSSSLSVVPSVRRIRTFPPIRHALAASVLENASSGPAAPCEVISTSSMVPSSLKRIGSMQAFLIDLLPCVERW